MYYQRFLTSRNIHIDVWFTQLRHEMRSTALTKILNTILSKTEQPRPGFFYLCAIRKESKSKFLLNFKMQKLKQTIKYTEVYRCRIL